MAEITYEVTIELHGKTSGTCPLPDARFIENAIGMAMERSTSPRWRGLEINVEATKC